MTFIIKSIIMRSCVVSGRRGLLCDIRKNPDSCVHCKWGQLICLHCGKSFIITVLSLKSNEEKTTIVTIICYMLSKPRSMPLGVLIAVVICFNHVRPLFSASDPFLSLSESDPFLSPYQLDRPLPNCVGVGFGFVRSKIKYIDTWNRNVLLGHLS